MLLINRFKTSNKIQVNIIVCISFMLTSYFCTIMKYTIIKNNPNWILNIVFVNIDNIDIMRGLDEVLIVMSKLAITKILKNFFIV